MSDSLEDFKNTKRTLKGKFKDLDDLLERIEDTQDFSKYPYPLTLPLQACSRTR